LISDYIIGNLVQIYCSINVVGQGINEQILSTVTTFLSWSYPDWQKTVQKAV